MHQDLGGRGCENESTEEDDGGRGLGRATCSYLGRWGGRSTPRHREMVTAQERWLVKVYPLETSTVRTNVG